MRYKSFGRLLPNQSYHNIVDTMYFQNIQKSSSLPNLCLVQEAFKARYHTEKLHQGENICLFRNKQH